MSWALPHLIGETNLFFHIVSRAESYRPSATRILLHEFDPLDVRKILRNAESSPLKPAKLNDQSAPALPQMNFLEAAALTCPPALW